MALPVDGALDWERHQVDVVRVQRREDLVDVVVLNVIVVVNVLGGLAIGLQLALTRTRFGSQQRAAAEEMVNVGKGGKVSEHVGPLVDAGAHPLQALMALHVIFSTSHARGQQAMAGKH